jgi:hypothetical protein
MPKAKATIHEFKYGLIKAVVAAKETKAGIRYTVSVTRLYRNGDQWKQSSKFSQDDIPVMRLLLDKAYGWILLQKQAAVEAQSASR